MTEINTHFRTCNLCESMCGLEIKYQNKDIIKITGDKNDVLSKGHICPKSQALADLYNDQDRLKSPIKKTANGWKDISWEEAFDEIAREIKRIQTKYGKNSIATYRGNPAAHNIGMMLFGSSFIQNLGSNQVYTATSADQLPHHFASLKMFGHYLMMPIPDIDRTDFMLILGANPAVSNGSIMTAPGFSNRLKVIKKRGGKVIVIDPRYTETAKIADKHYFIQPNRDALLLFALIHVIFDQNLALAGHLAGHINGWNTIRDIAKHYKPEQIAPIIGIESEAVRELAIQFATAKTAVCYGRFGVSTQEFGGISQWLINVLNTITGNMDAIGGVLFTLPAIDVVGMSKRTGRTGSFNSIQTNVRHLPEFTGEFPVATLADEILNHGENPVKAMITIAGNPILSVPDGQRLEKAFDSLEFMVSIDIYLNETSKYADIILPTTTGLETPVYDLIFHQFAVRNTVKYSKALFDKDDNQRHDWEILKELNARLGGKDNPLNLEQSLDFMLRFSPYRTYKLSVNELKKHPHGIDFGHLKSQFPERLFTKDKKIELAHPSFIEDLKRLDKQMENWQRDTITAYPFVLIGRRHLRSNNSWMHNSLSLMKGKERCTLLINPNDAEQLNLSDKQIVRVVSEIRAVEIPIEISDTILSGVLSMPHGWGHNRKGTNIHIAQEHAGVSINDLTDTRNIDELTANADFSGTRVKIEV